MSSIEEQVADASPAQLIAMLYTRAVRDLEGACEFFSVEGNSRAQADAIRLIVHAQQIIAELNRSLDTRDGEDLVTNLARIYEYMQYRLTEAVSKREQTPVSEVCKLLTELRDVWAEVTGTKGVKGAAGAEV